MRDLPETELATDPLLRVTRLEEPFPAEDSCFLGDPVIGFGGVLIDFRGLITEGGLELLLELMPLYFPEAELFKLRSTVTPAPIVRSRDLPDLCDLPGVLLAMRVRELAWE